MKRILALLMSWIICLTILPVIPSLAADVSDLTYEIIDGEVTITGCSDSAAGTLSIPAMIEGYPVTRIDKGAFAWNETLTNIAIPDSVRYIGERVFAGCTGLTGIHVSGDNPYYSSDFRGVLFDKNMTTLIQAPRAFAGSYAVPGSVKSIESYAFAQCDGLKNISFSEGLISIGDSTFFHCDLLSKVTIPGSVTDIGTEAFGYCTKLRSIEFSDGLTYISEGMCSGCSSLTTVVFPDSLTRIEYYAFAECTGLRSVTFPDAVTHIEDRAFEACKNLTSVSIPDSIVSVGRNTFDGCALGYAVFDTGKYIGNETNPYLVLVDTTTEDITSCIVHSDARVIADMLFFGCTKLKSVSIPGSVVEISTGMFSCCRELTQVTIADGVTRIGDRAFEECIALYDMVLPDSIISIGTNAFINCEKLRSITLSNGLISIGEGAFMNCKSLSSVTLPDGLTNIGSNAFRSCRELRSVTFSNSLTSIGDYAFYVCPMLTGITLPDSLTSIGEQAFVACSSLGSLKIPDSVTELGAYSFQNSGLTSVELSDSLTEIEDGTFSDCSSLTNIAIPNGVTHIGYNAFGHCTSLSSVTLPDSLTGIGKSAFYDTGLTGITIPNGITSLEPSVFAYCQKLTDVTLSDGLRNIDNNAFRSCTSLSNITLPNGVASIGSNAFERCESLTEITIPESVTEIMYAAFKNSGLTNIYFCGDAPEFAWNVFDGLVATVKYHAGTEGWTDDVKRDYAGTITWAEVEHYYGDYISDNNYTCTADGTKRATCLTCGEVDVQVDKGSAQHRYVNQVCTLCGDVAYEANAVLTGVLTTWGDGETLLSLTVGEETVCALTAGDGMYVMDQLNAGDYVLLVSKYGCVSREYPLTLTQGENVLNLRLNQKGDINGDGKLNMGDIARIYAQVKQTALLTDDYQILCADLNGDGKLNMGDTARAYALVKAK